MTAPAPEMLTVAEVAARQRDPLPLFDFGALRADATELAEWITRQRRMKK